MNIASKEIDRHLLLDEINCLDCEEFAEGYVVFINTTMNYSSFLFVPLATNVFKNLILLCNFGP